MQIRVDYIGNERAPVIVIEDVWADPQSLVEAAAHRTDYSVRSLYYPGVRSNAPPEYVRALTAQLTPLIQSTFGVGDPLQITDATFSLVATPPEKLVAFQRVPHFDSTDPNRFALLHYLCGPECGGTSFYRHRSSGIEAVTDENRETYIRAVNAEAKATGMPPARFIEGDTAMFERIGRYECAFNRALIYRGRNLHSVNTPPGFVPSQDPRTGRLTVNTFLLAAPA
ncbi:MAG TPA: DUF6445 family protein [Steroidobacteraceae bacterium]|nr:DUF6445 family protein [Steroidobacteraceae bacterium]